MRKVGKMRGLGRPKENLAKLKKVMEKSEKALRVGNLLITSAGAVWVSAVLFSRPEKLPKTVFLAAFLGALSLPFAFGAIKGKAEIMTKCIGKPRIARTIIEASKNSLTKNALMVLGNGKFNITEKEAIQAMLQLKPTQLERNYANRALRRETKRLIEEGLLKE